MSIRILNESDITVWFELRQKLWPTLTAEENRDEQAEILRAPKTNAVFLAAHDDAKVVGFAEFSIRDWAEGCDSRNVGYIEGWYVEPEFRNLGYGRRLVEAGETWARMRGARHMASDAELDNELSQMAHARLGYQEVLRSVLFAKPLMP